MIRVLGTGIEGRSETQFNQPRGICIHSTRKEIFVSDSKNFRVQVFDSKSFLYLRQIGKGIQGNYPGYLNLAVGICLHEEKDELFVADTNNSRVVVFNLITGAYLRQIGDAESLDGPYGVCMDKMNNLLCVADYEKDRVILFNLSTGRVRKEIGSNHVDGCNLSRPIALCVDDENGYMYVCDYNNNRVCVYTHGLGTLIQVITHITPSTEGSLHGPRGVCIDKSTNLLFISDRENHRVAILDKFSLSCLRVLGSGPGVALGQFNRPMELVCNVSESTLLVVDGYNNRVQSFPIAEMEAAAISSASRTSANKRAQLARMITAQPSKIALQTPLANASILSTNLASLSQSPIVSSVEIYFPMPSSSEISLIVPISEFMSVFAIPIMGDFCCDINNISGCELDRTMGCMKMSQATDSPELTSLDKLFNQQIFSLVEMLVSIDQDNTPVCLMYPLLQAIATIVRRLGSKACLSSEDLNYETESASDRAHVILWCCLRAIQKIAVETTINDAERLTLVNSTIDIIRMIVSRLLKKFGPTVVESYRFLIHAIVKTLNSLGLEHILPNFCGLDSVQISCFHPESKQVTIDDGRIVDLERLEGSDGINPCDMQVCIVSFKELIAILAEVLIRAENNLSKLTFASRQNLPLKCGPVESLSVPDSIESLCTERQKLDEEIRYNNSSHSSDNIWGSRNEIIWGYQRLSQYSDKLSDRSGEISANSGSIVWSDRWLPGGLADLLPLFLEFRFVYLRSLAEGNQSSDQNLQRITLSFLSSAYVLLKQNFDEKLSVSSQSRLGTNIRGKRNVWRQGSVLLTGDLIDAMDKERIWYESYVVDVNEDGSVRVHFMGWGSRWDDTISSQDFSRRIAPLNSKSKNWRQEIYEGALIEVKCNDDMVNQKWMWGRVLVLNGEEEWIDVAYQLADKPTVIKRVDIYGEEICPLGMHTKDKSRLAERIPKPQVKVEDHVTKKYLSSIQENSAVEYFDLDDTLLDQDSSASSVRPLTSSPVSRKSPSQFRQNIPSDSPFSHRISSSSHEYSTPPRPTISGLQDQEHLNLAQPAANDANFAYIGTQSPRTPGVRSATRGISTSPERTASQNRSTDNISESKGRVGATQSSVFHFPKLKEDSTDISSNRIFLGETSPIESVTKITRLILDRMMGIMLQIVIQFVPTSETEEIESTRPQWSPQLFELSVQILKLLVKNQCHQMIAGEFIRKILVHVGLRAKISLKSAINKFDLFRLSSMNTMNDILQTFDKFQDLAVQYIAIIEACLGDYLSESGLSIIKNRFVATVQACGQSPLADYLIANITTSKRLISQSVLYEYQNKSTLPGIPQEIASAFPNFIFRELIVVSPVAIREQVLRRLFRKLLDSATVACQDNLYRVWILVMKEIMVANCLREYQKFVAAELENNIISVGGKSFSLKDAWAPELAVDDNCRRRSMILSINDSSVLLEYFLGLIQEFTSNCQQQTFGRPSITNTCSETRSWIQKINSNLGNINDDRSISSVEVATYLAFQELPMEIQDSIALACACGLAKSLDTSTPSIDRSIFNNIDYRKRILGVIKMCFDPSKRHQLVRYYEVLLGRRLMTGRFSSLDEEEFIARELPGNRNLLKMLESSRNSSTLLREFRSWVWQYIDCELDRNSIKDQREIDYSENLNSIELALISARSLAVSPQGLQLCQIGDDWPSNTCKISSLLHFQNLLLPFELMYLMRAANEYFCGDDKLKARISSNPLPEFVHGGQSSSISKANRRKLIWLLGSGTVEISCWSSIGTITSIIMDEAQASILCAFRHTSTDRALDIVALSKRTGLSVEITNLVARSLCACSPPLLQVVNGEDFIQSSKDDFKLPASLLAPLTVSYRLSEELIREKSDLASIAISKPAPQVWIPSASASDEFNLIRDVESLWRATKIESQIIRILKSSSQQRSLRDDSGEVTKPHNIFQLQELVSQLAIQPQSSQNLKPSIDEIANHCIRFCSVGIIYCVNFIDNTQVPNPSISQLTSLDYGLSYFSSGSEFHDLMESHPEDPKSTLTKTVQNFSMQRKQFAMALCDCLAASIRIQTAVDTNINFPGEPGILTPIESTENKDSEYTDENNLQFPTQKIDQAGHLGKFCLAKGDISLDQFRYIVVSLIADVPLLTNNDKFRAVETSSHNSALMQKLNLMEVAKKFIAPVALTALVGIQVSDSALTLLPGVLDQARERAAASGIILIDQYAFLNVVDEILELPEHSAEEFQHSSSTISENITIDSIHVWKILELIFLLLPMEMQVTVRQLYRSFCEDFANFDCQLWMSRMKFDPDKWQGLFCHDSGLLSQGLGVDCDYEISLGEFVAFLMDLGESPTQTKLEEEDLLNCSIRDECLSEMSSLNHQVELNGNIVSNSELCSENSIDQPINLGSLIVTNFGFSESPNASRDFDCALAKWSNVSEIISRHYSETNYSSLRQRMVCLTSEMLQLLRRCLDSRKLTLVSNSDESARPSDQSTPTFEIIPPNDRQVVALLAIISRVREQQIKHATSLIECTSTFSDNFERAIQKTFRYWNSLGTETSNTKSIESCTTRLESTVVLEDNIHDQFNVEYQDKFKKLMRCMSEIDPFEKMLFGSTIDKYEFSNSILDPCWKKSIEEGIHDAGDTLAVSNQKNYLVSLYYRFTFALNHFVGIQTPLHSTHSQESDCSGLRNSLLFAICAALDSFRQNEWDFQKASEFFMETSLLPADYVSFTLEFMQCGRCGARTHSSVLRGVTHCQHWFCKRCWVEHVYQSLSDGETCPTSSSNKLFWTCPCLHPGCVQYLRPADILAIGGVYALCAYTIRLLRFSFSEFLCFQLTSHHNLDGFYVARCPRHVSLNMGHALGTSPLCTDCCWSSTCVKYEAHFTNFFKTKIAVMGNAYDEKIFADDENVMSAADIPQSLHWCREALRFCSAQRRNFSKRFLAKDSFESSPAPSTLSGFELYESNFERQFYFQHSLELLATYSVSLQDTASRINELVDQILTSNCSREKFHEIRFQLSCGLESINSAQLSLATQLFSTLHRPLAGLKPRITGPINSLAASINARTAGRTSGSSDHWDRKLELLSQILQRTSSSFRLAMSGKMPSDQSQRLNIDNEFELFLRLSQGMFSHLNNSDDEFNIKERNRQKFK